MMVDCPIEKHVAKLTACHFYTASVVGSEKMASLGLFTGNIYQAMEKPSVSMAGDEARFQVSC